MEFRSQAGEAWSRVLITPEEAKYVDVTGFASGSVVKDPYTGKFFLVP
jgi:hypothetical protein